jgi:hypothetical protein
MKVTIKPVPKEQWHGKKGKESFSRPKSFEVCFDSQTGGYATGLTKEEEEKYGTILGVKLDSIFRAEEPHPYWASQSAKISLPNHTMILETDRAADFVKWKNMKASKEVANSLKEWEDGLWPEATHVIYDESEEVEIKASKISKRNACIIVASKLSMGEKLNLVQILSNKSLRNQSEDFVNVEIDKIIDEKVDEFIKWTRASKEEVSARAQIMEGLFKHTLVKQGLNITYMGETIGHDVDQAVEYFLNPDNQAMKLAILEKITGN